MWLNDLNIIILLLFLSSVRCLDSTNNLLTQLKKLRINDGNVYAGSSRVVPAEVDEIVTALEFEIASKETLKFPELWNVINGNWRLLYTNNAASRPPNNKLLSLNKVIQRVDGSSYTGCVENVLCYSSPLGSGEVKLVHFAKVESQSSPALLSIDLDSVQGILNLNFPYKDLIKIPELRRGYFEVRLNFLNHYL